MKTRSLISQPEFRWIFPALALFFALPLASAVAQGTGPNFSAGLPAIAFDQIDRILLHGESPPAADSFSADAAVIAALPPLTFKGQTRGGEVAKSATTMLVSSALGMVPIAGPLLSAGASRGMNVAMQAEQQHEIEKHNAELAHFISAGTLAHFAFYHRWIRSERRGELTIVKPDQGLTLLANLSAKTVRVINQNSGTETIVIDTTESLPKPTIIGEASTERLPDAVIGGVRARAYRTTATIELKNAMSWCSPGRHQAVQVEYVTDLPDPQAVEATAMARALADGCEPASTASYREPGHLILYRANSIDPNTPKGITLMFERGNVRRLDESSMTLFSVPADFKKEQ
jgi:hypothetical protein